MSESTIVDRTQFIGGSDIAAILGLSRYATPLSVWAEKTGQFELMGYRGQAMAKTDIG